jgi:hypothetical protein
LLGLDRSPPYRDVQQNGILRDAFGRGPTVGQGRAIELSLAYLRRTLLPRTFAPRRIEIGDNSYEEFDAAFFDQRSGTWLDGWFQSQRYFTNNMEQVRKWFRAKPEDERRLKESMAQWPEPPEGMVAVHVRRGDYANVRDDVSNAEQGWLLPLSYYHQALDQIPRDAGIAVFSDDPDWAVEAFADRRPWISRNNSATLDMLLMARCRWNVIANSSFSWWSAWLNDRSDKIVFAPRFHLGWRNGRWLPGGIKVDDWIYLVA